RRPVAKRFSVGWTFLTPHGQVLLCIAADPGVRLEQIGAEVEITEAAARGIVDELADAGYITRETTDQGTRYTVNSDLPLPDRIARDQNVGVLVELLVRRRRDQE
ncbi:MAG TPA: helix-turn-helix domain-containing protein, partial [Solirubrobacteraceae bacterium]|nr:helix-turn-helix domain-containing protein [Solirubrobacteraceae bacterium]